ncbi:hypothetical protein ASD64_15895 [Mesorhizobium sp. Root157]|uniref:SPOR domain-containing protein n=1 Tax=Mesorhizobium sp. Root157 TaxID=1736477 RepID=UPI0006FCF3A9|nr:SPOR domain-containing protein [Mesorhizobium sp. Root157]KQZ98454.1 hypothetical protein ASD64_15895 [Mesorhizobium sp. Root157]
MAERTQLRTTDRDQISEDDPFAELTRIMGFDPRVSVKQDTAQPQADAAEDFAIDLEKELMGEFGAADETDPASLHAASAGPRYSVEGEAEVAPRFEDDIAAALDQDFEFEDDVVFDEAELAGEAAPVFEEKQVPVADDKPAEVELQSDAREYDERDDEAYGAFDALDFELTEAGEEDVAPAGVVSTGDFDADFDRAMADVDMDFEARPTEAGAAAGQEFDLPEFEELAVADEAASTADVEDEPVLDSAAYEEPSHAGEPVVEPVAAQGASLEDELSALLNQMSARPLAVQPHEEAAPADHAAAGDAGWSQDEAPVAPEQDTTSYLPSDDLDADLVEELEAETASAADEGEALEAAGIDFDHSTFDAALTAEMDIEPLEEEAAASEQPVAALQDPIEALQWLAAKPVADAVASSRIWSRGTPYIQPQQTSAQPIASTEPAEPEAFSADQSAYEIPAAYDVALDDVDPVISGEAEVEIADEAYEAAEPAVAAPAYEEVPDIETVDVPERVVALADDLDIPDVPYQSEDAEKPLYDDLEAEFTTLLTEMNTSEPANVAAQPAAYEDDAYGAGFGRDGSAASAYGNPRQNTQTATVGDDYDDQELAGFDVDDLPGSRPLEGRQAIADDDLAFDPDFDEEMSLPDPAAAAVARQPRNRVVMVAALVGVVALIGGIGAFALSFGGGDGSGAPVLVKADDNPIKVKPENPGGTVIPNQDNKVYDMVANGAKPAAPVQEELVTDAEEPVDVIAKAPEMRVVEPAPAEADAAAAQPSGKSEERIMPAAVQPEAEGQSDVALVTPRKVRTMIVKPDGSLVPREEPQPAAAQVAATEPADPAPQLVVNPTADEQTGAVAPATETQADQSPIAAAPASETALAVAAQPQAAQPSAQSAVTPALAPVAPQRPAEQPVDIVGEVKPDQVAAVNPASAVAASGSWSMQIASQPSVESAQSTYQDLARRYSSVLEGRSVNIVKAEVAGKGTFYRVRVAANSRNEAISLCENYKAAGGNCFVSK